MCIQVYDVYTEYIVIYLNTQHWIVAPLCNNVLGSVTYNPFSPLVGALIKAPLMVYRLWE